METRIIRNASEQNMNKFMLTVSTGNSTCKHNDVEQCHIDGIRRTDAWSRTSALALLGTHNQEQLSPADKSTRSRSLSNDGSKIGSDQEDWLVQRLLELKIEIQEAKEHLRNAQDKLAWESSEDSSQSISGSQHSYAHPIQDGKENQHSKVSDKNIRQVVCNLHDCCQYDVEMQKVYQAHKITSARICRNSEVV